MPAAQKVPIRSSCYHSHSQDKLPGINLPVTMSISPGATSRTRWKPIGPKAQSSDATQYSFFPFRSRLPKTSGLDTH